MSADHTNSATSYPLIDSHCHLDCLDAEALEDALEALLPRWHQDGLRHMLCVCINLQNFPNVLDFARRYPFVSASVGVHPCDDSAEEVTAQQLVQLAADSAVVAIGETGLDYFKNPVAPARQQARFAAHIDAALRCAKPIIVHSRDAKQDTLGMLKECGAEQVGGVMHCFVEDWDTAQRAMDLNFYISFSGIVTFANADALRSVVRKMPLDRILVETDAPYLAPVPKRGKANIPPYVRYVAEKIGEIKNLSWQQVAQITSANYDRLFGGRPGTATA